jgi:predicted porin
MNMLRILFVITALLTVLGSNTYAQTLEVPPDSLELSFRPYGSFRGHLAFYNEEVEMQENGSRIGFEFGVKKRKVRYFVGAELQLNMFKSNASFNTDANTSGGFIVAEKQQERQVFATRLGFIGVDLQKWGTISVGKQWGVYYDVTSYTDKFNVFGGQASATYVAGTDGGAVGTGRADQALIYRNKFGPVSFGAQVQARTGSNGHFLDGFGLSVQVNVLEGLKAGVAFNQAFMVDSLINSGQILGLRGHPDYFTIGSRYTSKRVDIGALYAMQTNGDLTQGLANIPGEGVVTPSVIFDATGFEFYSKLKFKKINLIAGYNLYSPDTEDISLPGGEKPISSEYERNYIILGVEYRPIETAYFYSEFRISSGKTALGTDEIDVLTLGLRVDVERILTKTIKR